MITLPIGLLLVVLVLIGSLMGTKLESLVNVHSIIIVVFGTAAVAVFSMPLRNIIGLYRSVLDLRRSEPNNSAVREAILALAKNKNHKVNPSLHPLINFAQDLWEQGLDRNLFEMLLGQRIEELNFRSEQPVSTLRNLAKYPPALGMTGTVIGMVALFGNLSQENKANIGPNLAVAMTATFYGLCLANFLFLPIGDRLHVRHLSRIKRNELVYQSLILINKDEPHTVVENYHRINKPYDAEQVSAIS